MMIISETRIQSFQSGDTGHGGDISQVSKAFNKQVASSISLHIDLCTMIRVYTEYHPSTSNSITRSGPQHHVIIIKSLYESPVEFSNAAPLPLERLQEHYSLPPAGSESD